MAPQAAAQEAARTAQLREADAAAQAEANKATQEAARAAQIREAEEAALADANKAAYEAQLRAESERLIQQREAETAAVAVAAAQREASIRAEAQRHQGDAARIAAELESNRYIQLMDGTVITPPPGMLKHLQHVIAAVLPLKRFPNFQFRPTVLE